MTRYVKTSASKAPSIISVESAGLEKPEKQEQEYTNPKAHCSTHGPSQSPLLDRELQKSQAREIIILLSEGLKDLANDSKCTKCTVQNISTVLTGHARDLRAAKENGEWSKEDRKALKAEAKAVFKPVKKDIKAIWKQGR